MSTAELDAYLLENWLDLEAATSRGHEIDNAVWEAIAEEARKWASDRGWVGRYDDDVWLAPPQWALSYGKRPDADARFSFYLADDDGDNFWLTALLSMGSSKAGFGFSQKRIKPTPWKAIVTAPELLSRLPGFTLQDNALFHPLKLDKAEVLEAAALGLYAQAVSSVPAILDRLAEVAEVIDPYLGPRTE